MNAKTRIKLQDIVVDVMLDALAEQDFDALEPMQYVDRIAEL